MNRNRFINFIQVFSFALISGMTTAISPLMHMLIAHYDTVPVTTVRMLSTVVSLCGMCVSVPLTLFFGKRLKFKPLLILGACLFLLGALPFFVPDPPFALVMFSRICVGVGYGFCALRNACVRRMFAGNDTAIALWLGILNATISIVGVVLGPIAGALADRFTLWHGFLVYLLASVSLILLTLIFKEPGEEKSDIPAPDPAQKARADKISPAVFRFAAVCAATTLLEYPIFTLSSTLAALRGWGGAAVGGSILSFYYVGSVSGSLFFPVQNSRLPRFGLALDYVFLTCGFGLMLLAPSPYFAFAGALFMGFGFVNQMLANTKWAGDSTSPATRTFASTLLSASVSLGTFISVFWIQAVGWLTSGLGFLTSEPERVYFVSLTVCAVFALLFFLFDPRPKTRR
ncbi:MAG: MFS transporter [Lachnospiraceae bacterium]|nr:MFS transporter [Lachnospiraceae bacterium]